MDVDSNILLIQELQVKKLEASGQILGICRQKTEDIIDGGLGCTFSPRNWRSKAGLGGTYRWRTYVVAICQNQQVEDAMDVSGSLQAEDCAAAVC